MNEPTTCVYDYYFRTEDASHSGGLTLPHPLNIQVGQRLAIRMRKGIAPSSSSSSYLVEVGSVEIDLQEPMLQRERDTTRADGSAPSVDFTVYVKIVS